MHYFFGAEYLPVVLEALVWYCVHHRSGNDEKIFPLNEKFLCICKSGDDEQARLISPALINTVQIGISCNTIEPDQPASFSRKFLKDKYGITDYDSLLRRVNEFFYHFNDESLNAPTRYPGDDSLSPKRFGNITHSTVFTNVIKIYYEEYGDIKAVRKALEDAAYNKENIVDFSYLRRFDVFVSAMELLDAKGLLPDGFDTLKALPVDAYYDGLTVTLVRMGVGAGYINETDAREMLSDVQKMVHEQYRSWKEFAAGYMIERAGFTDYTIEPLADVALSCLQNADSPWNRFEY